MLESNTNLKNEKEKLESQLEEEKYKVNDSPPEAPKRKSIKNKPKWAK